MTAQAKGTGRTKGSRGPAKPKAPAAPQAQAKLQAQAKPKTPAVPQAPAKPQAQAKLQAQAEPQAPAKAPAALRVAAAAQAMEAVGLGVAAVFGAVSTADGKSYQTASGIALTLVALVAAAGLAAVAAGLAKAKPWSRTPAFMTQLFVVIAGITLLDGNRPEWGVPALLLAAVCVAGLLTPASLRALNRPPSGASRLKRE